MLRVHLMGWSHISWKTRSLSLQVGWEKLQPQALQFCKILGITWRYAVRVSQLPRHITCQSSGLRKGYRE